MPTNFSNLSPELQTIFLTVPMYLPSTQNPDAEMEQQIIARQNRFLQLPKSIRWKLASFETGYKIEAIGQKYGFELLHLANITRLVREYYFGEARLENFPAEIERRMGVSAFTAQEIARYIKSEIIDWDPWGQYIATLPKMTVRDIVQNRPKLAELEITDGYITFKNSEDLFDPSIKNWIRDYVAHLGYEKHSQMQRTQYLFHSENGRDLSSQDREKLGIILRSFDENTALPVDEENEEVVFDTVISEKRPANSKLMPVGASELQPATAKGDLFIKPYSRQPQIQKSTPPIPKPVSIPPRPIRPAAPQTNRYFSASESEIPGIKIQSITEHNEPRTVPMPRPGIPEPPKKQIAKPLHKIINPFSKPMPEPRIEGNIVDLSNNE